MSEYMPGGMSEFLSGRMSEYSRIYVRYRVSEKCEVEAQNSL